LGKYSSPNSLLEIIEASLSAINRSFINSSESLFKISPPYPMLYLKERILKNLCFVVNIQKTLQLFDWIAPKKLIWAILY
jgi:hypothetical protein